MSRNVVPSLASEAGRMHVKIGIEYGPLRVEVANVF